MKMGKVLCRKTANSFFQNEADVKSDYNVKIQTLKKHQTMMNDYWQNTTYLQFPIIKIERCMLQIRHTSISFIGYDQQCLSILYLKGISSTKQRTFFPLGSPTKRCGRKERMKKEECLPIANQKVRPNQKSNLLTPINILTRQNAMDQYNRQTLFLEQTWSKKEHNFVDPCHEKRLIFRLISACVCACT